MKSKVIAALIGAIAFTAIAPLAVQACGDKQGSTSTSSEPVEVDTTSS
ncbi:MAG: hypothetical protein QNJ54_14230 [Prochloraceae cyanobacterium]|nr:hypothetical protein [Prochloraceae cyanobacterium]